MRQGRAMYLRSLHISVMTAGFRLEPPLSGLPDIGCFADGLKRGSPTISASLSAQLAGGRTGRLRLSVFDG